MVGETGFDHPEVFDNAGVQNLLVSSHMMMDCLSKWLVPCGDLIGDKFA